MRQRFRFTQIVTVAVVVGAAVGIAGYGAFGVVTDKGTIGTIGAENAVIMAAENASCRKYGHYATVATLLKERLLATAPVYNSVVIVPGPHCGSVVVGSAAYQSPG